MHELASDLWLQLGTGVIWDANALHTAAERGVTVSLREALGWLEAFPGDTPGGARVILVTGLQTALNRLPADDVDRLLGRVRTLIQRKTERWPESALLFAMPDPTRLHVDAATQSILLSYDDRPSLDLGARLWLGAAREASRVVVARPDGKGKTSTVVIGYWLRRAS